MKLTVITPVYNGETMIASCVESVLMQSYQNFEYIIMDAVSSDRTVSIINQYNSEKIKLISEKDRGMYDAMNKAIPIATGDIVCFLCADDMYAHKDVFKKVAEVFGSNTDVEIVYSDIVYVNRKNITKVDRYWKSSPFKPGLYRKGWLPPATSFFIRRTSLMKYGAFNIHFKFAADYEFNFRLLEKNRLRSLYLNEILVKMRSGGMSNAGLKNIYKSLKDCYRVLSYHHVKQPVFYIINTLFYRAKQMFIPSHIKKLNKVTRPDKN